MVFLPYPLLQMGQMCLAGWWAFGSWMSVLRRYIGESGRGLGQGWTNFSYVGRGLMTEW